ncbi:MAG: monovalent cation/H(+) antiporter subunit G [Mariniblastus sp.]|nr:monovalent cation/H(+) antiporter subunit G [Mariniblastus sp.]
MAFEVIDIASWVFLLLGSFFSIVGGIGIVRFPEFFSRLHAGGVTDTLGATLIVVGLLLQAGDGLIAIKLLMILFFLLVTSPTSCHALAKSAISQGMEPVLDSHEPATAPVTEDQAE